MRRSKLDVGGAVDCAVMRAEFVSAEKINIPGGKKVTTGKDGVISVSVRTG